MADFRNVDATDFTGWSTGEVRAFARALSSSGVAADARAIATAGEKLADSIAELERDAAAIGTRWQGEAREGSYAVIGQYTAQSYETGAAVAQLVGRVQSLSATASSTKSRFGELPDPPRGETGTTAVQRALLAAELGRTYTAPVKSSASAMPLSEPGGLVSFVGVGPQLVRRDRGGTVESPEPGVEPSQPDGGAGTPVGGSGADPTGAVDVPDGGPGAGTGAGTGTEDGAGSDTRTGGESGTPTGAGTAGTGAGGAAAPGGGAGQAPGAAEETGATGLEDPVATDGAPSGSLLTPAASVPGTPAVRTAVGGAGGGVRVPDGVRTASPLGLRQDAAALRTSAGGGVPGSVTPTGARPTSGPYGMPPAGAAGQRGQGDGRHRVPAYLIDKRNGEELVGEMPLVGPGVIGQWRPDGAPDPRPDSRPEAPPVRAAPRSR